jgi:hypothetical protein
MNADLKIEISPQQQELILRGLRFVRSSVALDMSDYSADVEQSRRRQYADIAELEGLLAAASSGAAASV